jgi:NAD(P)H-flavin reductase
MERILPKRFSATLTKKEKISSKVYEVHLTLTDPPEIEFHPGHTVMIYIEEGVNRSMSIASPSTEKKELTICWDISPMGKGCQWLLARNVGDSVSFMGPLGVFLFDYESPRKPVFIGTGTGISPFFSALSTYEHIENACMYWGLRHEEDIFWKEKLTQYAVNHNGFGAKICLSQPSDNWQGRKGHVQDFLFLEERNLGNSDFYLCGNGKMIEEVTKQLLEKGVPKEQIKREMFFG